MCGITGIYGLEDKNIIRKMTDVISHRGPDDRGYYNDKNISLGHRRLSIIDLSEKGKQPMTNEEGDIVIVYNGEIYNYKELREKLKNHKFKSNTDTEVIVHLYEEYGEEFISQLNGDFAFFIYDKNKNKGILARDRFGIKPLYYYFNKGIFLFASEIKSILEVKELNFKVKKEAVSDFITYSFVPDPYTVLENVYKVSPSEIITIDFSSMKLSRRKYYSLNFKKNNINFNKAKDEFYNNLDISVEKRMVADVPVGAYLSGGLDSSSVVAIMKKYNNKELNTFAVGFDSSSVQNELDHANKVSKFIGTNHKEIIVKEKAINELNKIIWHLDEPINNIAAVPLYFLSKEARKKVKVILNGNGSDELLLGYRHYKLLNSVFKYRNIIPKLPFRSLFKNTKYDYIYNILLNKNDKEKLHRAVLYKNFDGNEAKGIYNSFNYVSRFEKYFKNNLNYLNQIQSIDLQNLLSSNLLIVDDKMSMANSVESRVPFLDHNLVNYSNSLANNYKMKGLNGKYILRKAMEKKLPKDIIWRNKYGFTPPLKEWFNFLKDEVNNTLSKSEYFNKKEIAYKFSNLTNHNINQLWQLYVFEKWNEVFMVNGGY